MAHRIKVTGRVDYPDGSTRVMYVCSAGDCVEGHVEATPRPAADAVVALLAAEHDGTGTLLGGLVKVEPTLVGEPC